ncbi:hypothetical protein DUI87_10965 [Hirundo rustica rustica]|uniref:Rna-directed dna polymerase from mobile element jockey-like n=1 Tax=Hirundo rustica rustica TaxID=333673 RepID=A0A3M0L2A7_HIRRU|nr:hypothetical protein DUI87_10965 [Hirundo rustica rustica]
METSDKWCPGGSVLRLILFNIFVGNMDSGIKENLNKSADSTRLCGTADKAKGKDAIQRDLDVFERWTNVKLMKFNKVKCETPPELLRTFRVSQEKKDMELLEQVERRAGS